MQLATYPRNADALHDGIDKAFRGIGDTDHMQCVVVESGADYKPPNGWRIDSVSPLEPSGRNAIWLEPDDS